MSHLLDPKRLVDHHDYRAALAELDALTRVDPDTPPGHRIDELEKLIDGYEEEVGNHRLAFMPVSPAGRLYGAR